LSRETIRWYQMPIGLRPHISTATAAKNRFIPRRRASRYSRAQLTRVTTSISSRPTMTARRSRANPSVTAAHPAMTAHPKNGWSQK